MSEKKLMDAGAECVCGDLILDGKTMGRYRNGQLILTDDGALKLLSLADEPAADTAKPVRKKKGAESAEPAGDPDPADPVA